MAMDMLENETSFSSVGALASRADFDLQTIGGSGTNVLNRSFLLKKMEIEFALLLAQTLDDASLVQNLGYLVLQDESAGSDADTTAESFDAVLEDKAKHNTVIWTRLFHFVHPLNDDADNILHPGVTPVFKTSKSFPKGFPLDKDNSYQWKLFNPTSTPWTTGNLAFLRVRYWGVFL